jgi:hypothetical protein
MSADLERVDVVAGQVPLPGMPDEGVLFHVDHGPAPEPLSYEQRLTLRRKALLDRGVHPLTRGKARPDLGTCGTCAHLARQGGTAGSYLKCARGPRTRGPATDVRAAWPACDRYEAQL